AEFLRHNVADRLLRLRFDLFQVDLGRLLDARIFVRPPAQQEVIWHEGWFLGAIAVIPFLQPGIDGLAAQLRELPAVDAFEGDLDWPPRHEYQQVGDEESDSLKEPFAERRRPAREGVAEAAAPDATGADQDNCRVRNGPQNVS